MRTGIYVFQPTTVTIHEAVSPTGHTTGAAPAAKAALMSYRQQGALLPIGALHLEPGIYQVLSELPVQITGDNIQIVVTPNSKDDWPTPPPRALSLEPGATELSVAAFFGAAKDASPNG